MKKQGHIVLKFMLTLLPTRKDHILIALQLQLFNAQ